MFPDGRFNVVIADENYLKFREIDSKPNEGFRIMRSVVGSLRRILEKIDRRTG